MRPDDSDFAFALGDAECGFTDRTLEEAEIPALPPHTALTAEKATQLAAQLKVTGVLALPLIDISGKGTEVTIQKTEEAEYPENVGEVRHTSGEHTEDQQNE